MEGFRKNWGWFGKKEHFIDLISIALVDEQGHTFYAVSKDFDLHRAWNVHDKVLNKSYPLGPEYDRVYWVRENVLRPIFKEFYKPNLSNLHHDPPFTYRNMKRVIESIGLSNQEIKDRVLSFVYAQAIVEYGSEAWSWSECARTWLEDNELKFYADFAGYDWVVFCALFGRMIDLPHGFPMFCNEIQQIITAKGIPREQLKAYNEERTDEHNALGDAKWGMRLLKEIKFTPAVDRRLDL